MVSASKAAIVMVEGGADEISEADMVAALDFGHAACQPIIKAIEELRAELGEKTREYEKAAKYDLALKEKVKGMVWDDIAKGYKIDEKHERYGFLKATSKKMQAELKASDGRGATPRSMEKQVKGIYEDLKYEYMRDLTCNGGRIGGRAHDKVREVTVRGRAAAPHPRLGDLPAR